MQRRWSGSVAERCDGANLPPDPARERPRPGGSPPPSGGRARRRLRRHRRGGLHQRDAHRHRRHRPVHLQPFEPPPAALPALLRQAVLPVPHPERRRPLQLDAGLEHHRRHRDHDGHPALERLREPARRAPHPERHSLLHPAPGVRIHRRGRGLLPVPDAREPGLRRLRGVEPGWAAAPEPTGGSQRELRREPRVPGHGLRRDHLQRELPRGARTWPSATPCAGRRGTTGSTACRPPT